MKELQFCETGIPCLQDTQEDLRDQLRKLALYRVELALVLTGSVSIFCLHERRSLATY